MLKVKQKYSYLLYCICGNEKRPNIYSVNPLHLILTNIYRYFEDINGNNYLKLIHTNGSNKKIKNMKDFGVESDI